MSKELILVLKHEEHPHIEQWFLIDKNKIHVVGYCPHNYPVSLEYTMSIPEALRQYALLTSTEGWYIEDESGWHDLIDELGVDEEPTSKMWRIGIDIVVGEYEHDEDLFFFGEHDRAVAYGESYLTTIWGMNGETEWDDDIDAWVTKDGGQAARLGYIREYGRVEAMTEKGAFSFDVKFGRR